MRVGSVVASQVDLTPSTLNPLQWVEPCHTAVASTVLELHTASTLPSHGTSNHDGQGQRHITAKCLVPPMIIHHMSKDDATCGISDNGCRWNIATPPWALTHVRSRLILKLRSKGAKHKLSSRQTKMEKKETKSFLFSF